MGRLTTALAKLSKARARVLGGLAVAAVLGGGLPAVIPTPAAAQTNCSTAPNPIVCENALPGNPPSEWDIDGMGDETIQGFGTDISVNVGQTIDFKIKTDASAYAIDIYRTGYYGGDGARKVASITPSASLPQTQPACLTDAASSLVDCGNWAVSASWAVPATAVSGVYIANLTRTDTGGSSHIIFVVRNDASTADLFFQTSDTTWQAYNKWGGYNFYPGPNGRAFKLSYNRPFDTRSSSPNGRDFYFASEFAMVRFLERNGYNTAYTTGVDTARAGSLIQNHKVFLSVGHDEYWSNEQRTSVESARDAGVNLSFFSGNEIYWKTRWEPSISASAAANRTIVCYKETWDNAKTDPSPQWTGTWRDPRFSPPADGGRPENALSGTAYKVNDIDAAIKVPADDGKMRFWRNTPVATQAPGATATLAPSSLGYESDEDLDNGFRPTGLFRLSTTTEPVDQYLIDYGSTVVAGTTTHNMTMYKAPSGARVFGAGTIQWSWGLDVVHDGAAPTATEDSRMQQATINLLADMGAQPGTRMAGLVAASASTDSVAPTAVITSPANGASVPNTASITVTGTATDTGGGVVAGIEVSTDGGTTWHPATGRATWTYTGPVQGFGTVDIKARAVDDSGNLQTTPASVSVSVSCPCSLFSESDVPALVTTPNEIQPIELGVKFSSSVDGWVSGVRFYKGATNTGTHTASLWTSGGVRLAQATFTSETASGWQTVNFSTPVEILADTVYVVSYFAPNGGYSSSVNYFSTARTSTPLRAPANGEQGANGVFRYGSTSAFPSTGFQGTNYWVDPLFTTVGPPDTTPPTVLATNPVASQSAVDPATPIQIAFSESMQSATITWNVESPAGEVTGTASYSNAKRVATFTPSAPLALNTQYTVTVSGAKDRTGNVAADQTWTFTTWASAPAGANCPCTIFGSIAPTTVTVNDPTEVELGVKFQASVDGFVSGVRFYKGPSNTGPYTVTLWSGAGAELASSAVYFDTASGWQTVFFPTPIAVTAGTTYVASYHTISGNYSATSGLLGSAVTNGPLTALASGPSGGNGVYTYGTRAFPGNSFNAASYGVDVVYLVPPDTTPPTVSSFNPGSGANSVPVGAAPKITFSETVVAGSVTATLTGPGGAVPATVALDGTNRIATVTPSAPLTAATAYTVTVTAAQDAAGNNLDSSSSVTFTTSGIGACPCSIFASDAEPPTAAAADNTPVELGTRFTVNADGFITALRFYKGPGNTGAHTGRLWSSTGTQLSTVVFNNETAGGWQTAALNPPVAVTAGTTYVASYWAPVGRYAVGSAFFTTDWVNGPFTAPASGTAGNGVFSTSEGAFPVFSFNATNYWVDAVFSTVSPFDTLPPTVIGRSPVNGATSVPPSTSVQVQFNEAVQPATVNISLANGSNPPVAGTAAYNSQTSTVTFSPSSPLAYGTTYTVTVVGATDTAGNVMTTPASWSFTTAAAVSNACPCSIWPDETAPVVASDIDARSVELGLKFRTDTAGFITGVRFYKGVANTGVHTGRLWTSTGTLLATATFTNESASGWQQVLFSTPVAVAADTTYVVSYYAPNGRFAADLGYFANSGTDRGVLHALRSGVDGVNGVFTYGGAGSFPTSGTTTNYWVDVVYNQSADITPPTVASFSPATGATGVPLNGTVNATFGEDVTAGSVVMTLRQTVGGTSVAGTTTYNAGTRTATFTPSSPLTSSTDYTVAVTATDTAGNPMAAPATSTFLSLDNVPPTITSVVATGSGTTATITWTTNEASTSVVNYGTTAATLNLSATGASNVTLHAVTLTGLTPNTRYHYRVTSADVSGNSTTSPASPAAPSSYAPTVAPIARTAVADFAGTNSNTLITNMSGGEVSLAPTIENNFDGTALGTGWATQAVNTGGTSAVSGGQVTIDGSAMRSTNTYGNTTAVEFTGVLGTVANRFVGFGNTTFASTGSARYGFSTGAGNQLQAVSRGGLFNLATNTTNLTASLATTSHVYRIERSSGSAVFKIDGVTVATHTNTTSSATLNVGGLDPVTGGGGVTVNWLRVLPYATSGTWTSNVIDASAPVTWGAFSFTSAANGGSLTVQTRTGNTAVPDGTWTAFTTRASGANLNVTARYIQYRITFTPPANRLTSPVVDSVTLAFAIP